MVLPTVIKGLGKAYLRGKGKKLLGSKSVDYWKNKVKQKKFTDAIEAAGAQITGKLKKTAAELEKLNKTLKKQKKILDD
jgi:hypothetical protein